MHESESRGTVVPVQILRPLQCASFVVQAYPYLPDTLAMLGILAEEAGEPPIRQLMAADNAALHPAKGEQEAPPAVPLVMDGNPVLVPAS